MYPIIVCDDDREQAQEMCRTLARLYPGCHTRRLEDAPQLLAWLEEQGGAPAILLLDIELGDQNTIALVEGAQRKLGGLQIIYVTGHIHYCTQVYDTRHSAFLVKPVSGQALKKAVDRARGLLDADRSQLLTVKAGAEVVRLRLAELLFLESQGRRLVIHTGGGELSVLLKLADLLPRLDERFVQCHKSFVVNMDRVTRYGGSWFILEGGAEVPVSQSRQKAVRQRFFDHVRGGFHSGPAYL